MRFRLFALGCKVNSYEVDALRQKLLEGGHLEAEEGEPIDLIVLNTCSVTATADQKSRQCLRRLRRQSPQAIIAVMGCYSERHSLEARSLGADIVIGTHKRDRLLTLIEEFQKNRVPIIDIPERHKAPYEELGAALHQENTRAYLKIQDGCDKFCSYCLIPYVRGNSRSRRKEDVIAEAKALYENGYQELIITGIESGCYGLDFAGGEYHLGNLISDLFQAIPSLPRLRISSLDASEIDESLLMCFKRHPALASHLHLSLQSGSKSVLERMRRHYDPDGFLEAVQRVRKVRPDIALTTDVIAGFPGESDDEWRETIAFCQRVGFAEIHVFPYSARQGTLASRWKGVSPAIKKARVHELLSLSKTLRDAYEARFYGRRMNVLFERYDEKAGMAYGHTDNYLLVKMPAKRSLHGEMLPIIYSKENAAD